MLGRLRNTVAEVDLTALEYNYRVLQTAASCPIIPMVKADAYGHGDVQVSRVCERLGAKFLGVALVEEGMKLRLAGLQVPLLTFSTFDSLAAEAMLKYRLTPVLSTFDQIETLKSILHDTARYPVHVEFNTGMQRLGFEPEDALKMAHEIHKDHFLKLEGVCTHFQASEDFSEKDSLTVKSLKTFSKIKWDIQSVIQNPILFHHMNSAAIFSCVEPKYDFARPGIALYGAIPSMKTKPPVGVKPVMTVKSSVALIHNVKKGLSVSYGGTWRAPYDAVVAVIPMGYADGVPRALSNKGKVLVNGEFCAIAGIVCMDYFMVDVTDLKSLRVGDEVILIGTQKDKTILAEDVAGWAGTNAYEILTGIQNRVPRIYIH